jgi:hypothetical protein
MKRIKGVSQGGSLNTDLLYITEKVVRNGKREKHFLLPRQEMEVKTPNGRSYLQCSYWSWGYRWSCHLATPNH